MFKQIKKKINLYSNKNDRDINMRNKTLDRLDAECFKFSCEACFSKGVHGWSFLWNVVPVNRK